MTSHDDKNGSLVERLRYAGQCQGYHLDARVLFNAAADALERTPSHVAVIAGPPDPDGAHERGEMLPSCPRCQSTNPKHHPATAFEGEVQLCRHPWHSPTADEIEAKERALPEGDSEAEIDKRTGEWTALEKVVAEYVDGYELYGENEEGVDACYTPDQEEKDLISDCIAGLLAEEDFIKAIAKVFPVRTQFVSAPSTTRRKVCGYCVEWERSGICPYEARGQTDRPAACALGDSAVSATPLFTPAQIADWLDSNTTHYDVQPDGPEVCTAGANIPVLAAVSKRIWYHATDDQEPGRFSQVVARALNRADGGKQT